MVGFCEIYQCQCELAKDDQYKNNCEYDGGCDCVFTQEMESTRNQWDNEEFY